MIEAAEASRWLHSWLHRCPEIPNVYSGVTRYWEPVSGFEPLTCRLQEVRPSARHALAAQITRIIALTALTTLGLSGTPVHEPVHGRGAHVPSPCYLT